MLGFIVILIVIEPFIIREVEFFDQDQDQDQDHDHDHDDLLRAPSWILFPFSLLPPLCSRCPLWFIPPNFSSVPIREIRGSFSLSPFLIPNS